MVDEPNENSPLLRGNEHGNQGSSQVEFAAPKGCCQQRYILIVLAFFGFFNVYAMRVNLSVALVAMVNQSYVTKPNQSTECPQDVVTNATTEDSGGDFNWNPSQQGTILSAFFYGYVSTQIPGGILSEKFGGKWFFGLGVLVTGVLTLLTPIAAETNFYLFIVVRVLEGIGEGVTFPAMHSMIGKWVPPLERSRLLSIAYAGAGVGTSASFPISGYLCKYGFAGGWPSVFYVFGSFACLWFVFWVILVYDSPSVHPWISEDEKNYIITTIGDTVKKKADPVPWKSILTSLPVLTICVSHVGGSYIFYTLLTNLPTYMETVMHFDFKKDGLLSALPYAGNFTVQLLSGMLTDFLLTKRVYRVTTARKINSFIGLLFPAAFLFGASYAGCDYFLGVTLLTISVTFIGFTAPGYITNTIDIAPKFAGSTFGFVNMVGNIGGIVAPLVVGVLTNGNQTQHQWRYVFWIASGVSLLGAIVNAIFASAERQPWSYGTDGALITESMARAPHEKLHTMLGDSADTLNSQSGAHTDHRQRAILENQNDCIS